MFVESAPLRSLEGERFAFYGIAKPCLVLRVPILSSRLLLLFSLSLFVEIFALCFTSSFLPRDFAPFLAFQSS